MSNIKIIVIAVCAIGLAGGVAAGFGVFSSGSGAARAQAQANTAQSQSPAVEPDKAKKKKRRATLVEVDKVRSEPVIQTMPVVGRLVAVRSGVVAARIDAPVAEMRVDVGDYVKKGSILAVLVKDRLKWDREQKAAELAAARAAVTTAKARLTLANQELQRYEDLRNSPAFPKARYEDKKADIARLMTEITEASAKVKKAHATLRLAETELSYTNIIAPYDGTITRRQIEAGAYVKEGQAIYSMISDRDVEIEVDVPAVRAGGLSPGMICKFELRKGQTFDAKLRAIVPEEDLRTRTRTVRLIPIFDTRPKGLAANQSATVHIPLGRGRKVLSFHKDALVSSRGQPTVFVVEDGRARARVIRIGESVGGRFEVLDGLSDGDVVVIRGNERLRDGSRVQVSQAARR